jgi:hypothetical protein
MSTQGQQVGVWGRCLLKGTLGALLLMAYTSVQQEKKGGRAWLEDLMARCVQWRGYMRRAVEG